MNKKPLPVPPLTNTRIKGANTLSGKGRKGCSPHPGSFTSLPWLSGLWAVPQLQNNVPSRTIVQDQSHRQRVPDKVRNKVYVISYYSTPRLNKHLIYTVYTVIFTLGSISHIYQANPNCFLKKKTMLFENLNNSSPN